MTPFQNHFCGGVDFALVFSSTSWEVLGCSVGINAVSLYVKHDVT
jgi:hypothetical protein